MCYGLAEILKIWKNVQYNENKKKMLFFGGQFDNDDISGPIVVCKLIKTNINKRHKGFKIFTLITTNSFYICIFAKRQGYAGMNTPCVDAIYGKH